MPQVRLRPEDPATLRVDALVVPMSPVARQQSACQVLADCGLPTAVRRRLNQQLAALANCNKPDDAVKVAGVAGVTAPMVVVVCIPERTDTGWAETLRRAAGVGVRAAAGADRIGVAIPASTPDEVAAICQGAALGAYSFGSFKGTGSANRDQTSTLLIHHADVKDRAVREAVRRAEIVTREVIRTRDLVNAPPSALAPMNMADAALEAVADLPVDVTIMDAEALRRGRFGGILAVGQSSANPPCLIRMSYRPTRPRTHLALVGKGITFDSGGLSLKPANSMPTMKSDMAGAAAVISATAAIARLGLPLSVTTYAACAENMPSGSAQRPGDVITMYGGRTVEVLNTDAEGRLVMADALTRASQDEPDVIVDVATLTGAQTVALGNRISAVMGNDDEVIDDVLRASADSGEQFWPMPLPPELRESLETPVADIANVGDRLGGMLTAGIFLQEFVGEGIPWAHLDIAGPAFNDGEPYGYTSKGGTGVAVRTLVRLAREMSDARGA